MIFKTRLRYWIITVGGVLLLYLGLTAAAFYFMDQTLLILSAAGSLMMPFWLIGVIYSELRTRVRLDAQEISGQIGAQTFHLPWADIRAVWTSSDNIPEVLFLGSNEIIIAVPLRYLDGPSLCKAVFSRVPQEVAAADSYKKLPQYIRWQKESAAFLASLAHPLRVNFYRWEKIIGWIFLGLGGVIYLLMASQRSVAGQWSALVLVIPGYLLALSVSGWLEMDPFRLRVKKWHGEYGIEWKDVRGVLISPAGEAIVMIGEEKLLALPGPGKWYGPNQRALKILFMARLQQLRLPLQQSYKALWLWSRRTRL